MNNLPPLVLPQDRLVATKVSSASSPLTQRFWAIGKPANCAGGLDLPPAVRQPSNLVGLFNQ